MIWYCNDSYLIENRFHRSESETTLYTKLNDQGNMLIVCMYVDGLIFIGEFGKQNLEQLWKVNLR